MAHDLVDRRERISLGNIGGLRPLLSEYGAPGTLIYNGFLVDEDYNDDLRGRAGLDTWDKMRRNDAQVAASLLAIELPIRAATWDVYPASRDPADVRIAQFVRDNLIGGMSITWDDYLRHALLHLQYGFMVFEKVFVEAGGYIRLKKLAPRLPRTIFRWNVYPDGGLRSVQQIVYALGYSGQIMPEIPGDKLVVFVNRKEGANWAGISAIRSAYKHWKIKDALYKIDAVHKERWGVGIPRMKLPEDYNAADRENAKAITQDLRGHENGYVVLPPGFELDILAAPSSTTNIEILESVRHHNAEISKNVFAQFMDIGTDHGGGRALGESFQEFFLLSLVALAKYIEDTNNAEVIPQLVDLNFPGVKAYPKLRASALEKVKIGAIADALQKLGSGPQPFISPTPELEAFLRERLDLPERPELKNKSDTGASVPDSATLSEPRDRSAHYLSAVVGHEELGQSLDRAQGRFADAVAAVQRDHAKRIAGYLREKGATPRTVRGIVVKPAEREALRKEILAHLKESRELGRQAVQAEAQKQRKNPALAARLKRAKKLADDPKKRPAETPPIDDLSDGELDDLLGLQADIIAGQLADGLVNKAKTLGAEAAAGRLTADEVGAELDQFIPPLVGSIGKGAVQSAFSDGRKMEFRELGDEVDHYIRTEILDDRLCDHCADYDDREYDPGDPDMVDLPDPECLGAYKSPGACRGLYVAVLRAETEGAEAA